MTKNTFSTPVSATGWLTDNWPAVTEQIELQPPVIVNPRASVESVMAWCYGELVSLAATSSALSCGGEMLSPTEIGAIFRHRLEPLADVIGAMVGRLQSAALSSQPQGVQEGAA